MSYEQCRMNSVVQTMFFTDVVYRRCMKDVVRPMLYEQYRMNKSYERYRTTNVV